MRSVRPSGPRVAHAVALAAAMAALALALGGPGALVGPLVLPVAAVIVVPFVEWREVPPALARALPRLIALVVLVVALFAWLSRSVGTLVLNPTLFPRIAGPVLAAAAVAFALAPSRFPEGRARVPAIVALLGVAGLDPSPAGYGRSALGFLKGSEHTAFAERYLLLAAVVVIALWSSTLLSAGPLWSRRALVALALTLVPTVALAAAGVIGLPSLQPRVERAVASAFAEGTTGLSGMSRLGEFSELALSRRRVLDLQTSLPAGGEWRVPSEVFTAFDGQRWKPSPGTGRGSVLKPAPVPSAASSLLEGIGAWFEVVPSEIPAVELRVTQADVRSWPLVLPRGLVAVTADAPLLTLDPFGLPRRPEGSPLTLYGALWTDWPSPVHEPLDAAEKAEALVLPPRLDPRVAVLARELSAATAGPRQRIEATVRYLQGAYRYTLAPGAFHSDDALAEFLFEKKAGYCEYFASAAVVLLRLQGVPARFVKGLAVGPHTDQGGGLHVVRESDAHAWIEAWVPGEGGVESDPTPPAQLAASRPRPSAISQWSERLRAALSSAWTRITARGPMAFLRWFLGRVAEFAESAAREPGGWLAFVAFAGLAWLWRVVRALKRRRKRPVRGAFDESVPPDLRVLLRGLEKQWARAGCARPHWRGLLEHAWNLTASAGSPALAPALVSVGPEIVQAYYYARFGGHTPSPEELRGLHQRLQPGSPL